MRFCVILVGFAFCEASGDLFSCFRLVCFDIDLIGDKFVFLGLLAVSFVFKCRVCVGDFAVC